MKKSILKAVALVAFINSLVMPLTPSHASSPLSAGEIAVASTTLVGGGSGYVIYLLASGALGPVGPAASFIGGASVGATTLAAIVMEPHPPRGHSMKLFVEIENDLAMYVASPDEAPTLLAQQMLTQARQNAEKAGHPEWNALSDLELAQNLLSEFQK